jgi:hypothetical protein
MGEWMLIFLVIGALLHKLSKLRVLHLEFGGKDNDDHQEPKQIKSVRPKKQLNK